MFREGLEAACSGLLSFYSFFRSNFKQCIYYFISVCEFFSWLVQSPKEDLEIAASSYMSSWIELASTPYGSALDPTKMFWPVAIPRTSHFRAAAKMRAVNLENELNGLGSVNGGVFQEKVGDASTAPVKIIVGSDVEMSVTHTRVVTSTALGIFASKLNERAMKYVIDPLSSALTSLSGVQRQVHF